MTAAAAEVPKQQTQTKPQPQPAAVKSVSPVVPIKIGSFGGQGAGKNTSAAMFALAKELHGSAPVWVTDTEPGWQFLRPMFATEGVKLEQRTVLTFKAMLADIREAERAGACVYAVDSLTSSGSELMRRTAGAYRSTPWGDIKAMWGEYTTRFLNSPSPI